MAYQRILVLGGRGGCGRSSLACGMASALALRGKRVVLVDFDLSERSLDMYLGMESRVVYDLGDLFSHRATPTEVALCHEKLQNLYLIPGVYRMGQTPSALATERVLGAISGELNCDCLILDGSYGAASLLAPLVDCCLVMTTPDALSIRSAASVVDLLRECSMSDSLLVINKMREQHGSDLRAIIDKVGIPLGGILPYDPDLALWQERGIPPHKGTGTLFGAASANIAMRLMGAHTPLLEGLSLNRNKWLGR